MRIPVQATIGKPAWIRTGIQAGCHHKIVATTIVALAGAVAYGIWWARTVDRAIRTIGTR